MSVNSLANFGVPGMNGDRSAQLQPVLTNKYRISLFDFGTSSSTTAPYVLTQQVRSVNLPSMTFGMATLYSYVSAVYIQTRGEWQQGTIVFNDDITGEVRTYIENQTYKQQNFYDQTSSRAGENYKFEMDVDILAGGASAGSDTDPNVLRKYSYSGCTLVTFDDGQMTYESANPKVITMGFRYDNVIALDSSGSQLGTYEHTDEIDDETGTSSTGVGSSTVSTSSITSTTDDTDVSFS